MGNNVSNKSDKPHLYSWVMSIALFFMTSWYLFIRRGYYNLTIANKCIAIVSFIIIGLSLIVGYSSYFKKDAQGPRNYPKYLGLVGFYWAIAHIGLSIFLFWLPWMFKNRLVTLFGTAAYIIFTMMACASYEWSKRYFLIQNPRAIFQWGKIAYIFVCLHVIILKFPAWKKWLATFVPLLPPLSLLGTLGGLTILGYLIYKHSS